MIDLDAARAEFQAARDAYIEHPDDPVLRREYLDVEKRFSQSFLTRLLRLSPSWV